MAKLFRGSERGAVSGYAISVIVLAVLLIGGMLLLKNTGGNKPNTDKPVTVNTGEYKADDEDKDKDKSKDEEKPASTKTPGTVATTGSTSTPKEITATGPEDFAIAIIGLILAGATIYTSREYIKSRSVIKSALLR
ncbi:MAG: hypothetical protein LBQ11_00625 [Candidatus Nomurabacteria bacterium]|jgi:hypothetical protein|nr:hypothetical protein [Candidatus Nomurabacteria bacterium]